jgi:RNA polymerase sigma-70 factor (ECF subfamily)
MNSASESYEELYRELFTPLFRYFIFRTRDYNLATDLVQTVFLKFLQSDYREREHEHNTRSLFTIARNTLIDHFRVNAKKPHISLENSGIEVVSSSPTPFEEFRASEDTLAVREAIATLSDIEQDIILLRIATELDHHDIAELVNESVENTRQIYSRALKKLKVYLENKKLYG